MKSIRKLVVVLCVWLALLAVGSLTWACVFVPVREPLAIWTPAPLIARPERTASPALILPTSTSVEAATPTPTLVHLAPTATFTPAPTATPTAEPATATSTAVPRATPTQAATPTPTWDPQRVVITEADIERTVAAGAGAQQGLQVDGLTVRFSDGKMRLSAHKLGYGMMQVQDLALVGWLVAQDGQLQLVTESISPRGLVTALIPTMANQALQQFAAQWYVEEVRIQDGYLEIRIR